MRTLPYSLAIPTALALLVACSPDVPAEPRIHVFSVEGDLRQASYYVVPSRIAHLSGWSPAEAPPPVPVTAIVEAAERWLSETQGLTGLSVDEVHLRQRRSLSDPHRFWYYEVFFQPALRKDGTPSLQPSAVVLIDGSIIDPAAGI
jgi:hypothetical protein